MITQVKSTLAQIIKEENISILEIDAELVRLSDILKTRINNMIEEYGLTMPDFFINRIITPDDDPNYRRMKEQYAQQYLLVKQRGNQMQRGKSRCRTQGVGSADRSKT